MNLRNSYYYLLQILLFAQMSKGAFQALIKENESAPMYSVGSALRYLSKAVFTKALLNSKFNE